MTTDVLEPDCIDCGTGRGLCVRHAIRRRRQTLLLKNFHAAWGACKESPEYDKRAWRVLSAVLEKISRAGSTHGAILDEIDLGNAILGLKGVP
jgi:hypothetical protein